uniref:Uncharacterized protein n=1 Tax=Panagrolaimus sp. JU765 TaxID=591449 RepID=A0AC34RS04_9BILA
MDKFPQLEKILEKNVISQETGFTQDLRRFVIVVYEENSKYHLFVFVEGDIEKTTEFSNEEEALETALLAFHSFKTKRFALSSEKLQKRTLQPQQTSFKESVKERKIGKKADDETKTTNSSSSNDPILPLTTILTQVVERMQESNENNSERLDRIIERLQDNQVELRKTLVSEQDKNRDFMREITIQNADLHREQRQHKLDMEQIHDRPLFGTTGGWVDSIFS